jgi:uncharacterized membrane protein
MKFSVENALTGAGAAIAATAAVALWTGVSFSLPPELYTVIVYKGILAAAAGLLLAGGLAGRYARRKKMEEKNSAQGDGPGLPASDVEALNPAPTRNAASIDGARDSARIERGGT